MGLDDYGAYSRRVAHFHPTPPHPTPPPSNSAYMRLNQCDFSGQIPSELGEMTYLRELWLWENALTGTIPSELGNLKDIGKKWWH